MKLVIKPTQCYSYDIVLYACQLNDNFHKYPFSIVFYTNRQTCRNIYKILVENFADPCDSNPCNGTNSHCKKVSATKYNCKCNASFVPKDGDAKKYGCKEQGNITFHVAK